MTDPQRRIRRALHTAREAAHSPGGLEGVRLKRFHAAMDALSRDEGEEVYRVLSVEPWYVQFRKVARPNAKRNSNGERP